MVVKELLLLW